MRLFFLDASGIGRREIDMFWRHPQALRCVGLAFDGEALSERGVAGADLDGRSAGRTRERDADNGFPALLLRQHHDPIALESYDRHPLEIARQIEDHDASRHGERTRQFAHAVCAVTCCQDQQYCGSERHRPAKSTQDFSPGNWV